MCINLFTLYSIEELFLKQISILNYIQLVVAVTPTKMYPKKSAIASWFPSLHSSIVIIMQRRFSVVVNISPIFFFFFVAWYDASVFLCSIVVALLSSFANSLSNILPLVLPIGTQRWPDWELIGITLIECKARNKTTVGKCIRRSYECKNLFRLQRINLKIRFKLDSKTV